MQGVGQRLAEARQAKGLMPADVAAQLKLSIRQVEALEAEDFAHLPGEIFVRGFIRNYAKLVELDPAELLPQVEVHVAEQVTAPSTNLRFRTSPVRRWLVIPVVGLVLFFALVALLYSWLKSGDETMVPESAQGQPGPAAVAPIPVAPAQPVIPPQPMVLDPASAEASGQADATPVPSSQAAPAPAGHAAPGQPVSATPATKPLPEPVKAPAEPIKAPVEPSKPAGSGLLFQPGEDAWVQVVDAKGQRFSKLLHAGSTEAFEGNPPYKIVVGNAAAMRLTYKGRLVALKPFTGEKVARLTLAHEGPGEANTTSVVPAEAKPSVPGSRPLTGVRAQ